MGIGLKDIMAIATPDVAIVASMGRLQDVKKDVEQRQVKDILQRSLTVGLAWEALLGGLLSDQTQLCTDGAALNLQSHKHQSEYRIVVEGTAQLTIYKDIELASEVQSVYVTLVPKTSWKI